MTRLLPTSVQTFEVVRNKGYLYVDKTRYIRKLREKGRELFLSRPRRFGKSLLVSTLEAYFLGKKELFRGLDIEAVENAKGDEAWTVYPVIPFYLASGDFNSEIGLEDRLNSILVQCIRRYDLTGEYAVEGESLPVRFSNLIASLYHKTNHNVVVLVDEYDNPLIKAEDPEQEKRNREIYKAFFSVLKDQDRYLEFVFFTGVTKYSKISVFSDLNQLDDISMWSEFSGICGFTEEEITENFSPEIASMATKNGTSCDDCIDKMRLMYDGYHFADDSEGMYNPYSLINALNKKKFDRYWFGSASPQVLINKLECSSITPAQLEKGVEVGQSEIMDYRIEDPDPIPLFYQAGYLTIKAYDARFGSYTLSFPNEEVKYGFLNSLLPSVLGEKDRETSFSAGRMVRALETGDVSSLYDQLYSLFASAPYMTTRAASYEEVWRNQIFLIFALIGEFVVCEQHTSAGRSDCVIETANYVYILEFKVNDSADAALAQIDKKEYAGKYRSDKRRLIRIGANFSSDKKNIDDWKYAESIR